MLGRDLFVLRAAQKHVSASEPSRWIIWLINALCFLAKLALHPAEFLFFSFCSPQHHSWCTFCRDFVQRCPKEKREELLRKCCSLHIAEDFLPILPYALAATQSMKTHLFVRSQDAEDKA